MAYVGIGNRQDYVADFQSQNFSGDGSTTAFTLNYEAVTGSIRVAVDNVLQPADGSSYTVDGFTLNFDTAPASGTNNITVLFLGTVRNISSVSDGAIINAKLQSGSFTNITDVGTLASGLTLSDNILFDTASKGIYLGVTSATASNLLDDYEEGTFTPTIEGSSTAGTATYSSQVGKYTKIGNAVTIQIQLNYSGGTGSGTAMYIKGLPFTSSSAVIQSLAIAYTSNISIPASRFVRANIGTNSDFIRLFTDEVGGGASNDLAYDAAGEIAVGGTYFI